MDFPEDRLNRVFDSYDTDKNGTLDYFEVEKALEEAGIPTSVAAVSFRTIDANGDGFISREEFLEHCRRSHAELRSLFKLIDVDQSGGITREEMASALASLRIVVDDNKLKILFSNFADTNGQLDFGGFSALFSLLDPVDLVGVYAPSSVFFESSAELLADLSVATREKVIRTGEKPSYQTDLVRMGLGGLAGMIAQTIVQPIETTKVRLQNDGGKKYRSFGAAFQTIAREEGARGLFKGMVPSAMRELSYSTLRFGLYAPIKKLVTFSGKKETLLDKIISGGLAGGIGSAIATPLDLLKTRAQASIEKPPTSFQMIQNVLRTEGFFGLYKGMSTTMARAVMIGSVKLASYDELKGTFVRIGSLDPKGYPVILSASICTGLLVSLSSAPIDFARTRLMSGRRPDGSPFSSGFDVLRREPIRHWYRGFFPQWARIAPYSIIQFVTWEKLCHVAGIKAV